MQAEGGSRQPFIEVQCSRMRLRTPSLEASGGLSHEKSWGGTVCGAAYGWAPLGERTVRACRRDNQHITAGSLLARHAIAD
jgi:hypothetical protein